MERATSYRDLVIKSISAFSVINMYKLLSESVRFTPALGKFGYRALSKSFYFFFCGRKHCGILITGLYMESIYIVRSECREISWAPSNR